MNKRNLFGMLVISLLLLFCSCSQETGLGGEENSGSNYGVRFTLGGSAGQVVTRAGETQTAEEKKVSSLYAVVFKDASGAAKTGINDQETGRETFYKCIDVLTTSGKDLQESAYVFEVGEAGAYQICFVANPSAGLKGKIEALTAEKTVNDFKKLTEDVQAPETKPMLMTSGFYGATVNCVADADLKTVNLTRAMARIDLVNKAPGVTITKAVFKKRAVKTVLIADKTPEFQADAVAEKIYDNLNLTGTQDGAVYKEQIYSYEQYGTDVNAPSLEITYAIDGKSYTHKVAFKKSATAGGQPINLKRNNLYKVSLSNDSGLLSLDLSVANWENGEVFEVSSEEIEGGVKPAGPDYSKIEIGDFMLKDGSLIKESDRDFAAKKKDAIGVVFYVGKARVGAGATAALKDKGGVHGLVMALKNAGSNLMWKNEYTTSGLPYKSTLKLAYDDFDGYGNTQKIYKDGGTSLATKYPAFNAVKTYAEKAAAPAPENTTGWYLPAAGEWYDILENLGGVKMDDRFKTDNGSIALNTTWTGVMVDSRIAASNINKHLQNVGGDNFDVDSSNSRLFWSSSEYSAEDAVCMVFIDNGPLFLPNNSKRGAVSSYRVRCVLAF